MTTRDDDLLLIELGAALNTCDPVPNHVIEAAKASLGWRRIDEELAQLVADSATQPLTEVRSVPDTSGPRLLTFEGPDLTVEVEVTNLGEVRRLVGQLVPPCRGSVEVRWPDGSTTCEADDIGHFTASSIPGGPISIACRAEGSARVVTTSWLTI